MIFLACASKQRKVHPDLILMRVNHGRLTRPQNQSGKIRGNIIDCVAPSAVLARHSDDGCRLCGLHSGSRGPPTCTGGHLEQYLVPALVLRRDQLHQQLALRGVRGCRFVDWRLSIDDVPTSDTDQTAATPWSDDGLNRCGSKAPTCPLLTHSGRRGQSCGPFQSSVDDDCKPYRAATNRAARIIPGNSTLATTTAVKSSSTMTITTLSPRLVPMTSLPFAD